MRRVAKLWLYYLLIFGGFAVLTIKLVFPEIISYSVAATVFILLGYISSFVIAMDVSANKNVSNKMAWVTAIVCMPIFVVPAYIISHGESNSLQAWSRSTSIKNS